MLRANAVVALFAVGAAAGACDSTTTESSTDGGQRGFPGGAGSLSTGGTLGSIGASGGRSTGGTGGLPSTSSTGGVTGNDGAGGSAGKPGVDAGSGGQDTRGSGGAAVDAGPDAGSGGAATAGAGGNAPDGGRRGEVDGGGRRPREFGYIAARSGGLLTCSINLVSGMAEQMGSPIEVPRAEPVAIAVHPSQRFVYVAYLNFQDGLNFIDTYPVASDGTLVTSGNLTVSTPDSLEGIAVEPEGRFAYAVSGPGKSIYMYRIDSGTGGLTAIGTPLLVGSAPEHVSPTFVAADPSGRFVYVSPAFGSGIFGYRIERSGPQPGALTELANSPFGIPGLADGGSAFGGAIAITPNGRFLYTSGGGRLDAYAIDNDDAGTTGALTPIDGSPFSLVVESDPQAPNLALDPRGEHLYATQFHSGSAIHGFGVDASGALASLAEPITATAPYSIAIEPSGHFLYVPNDGNTLTVYSIAPTGALTELGQSQFGGLEAKMVFATLP